VVGLVIFDVDNVVVRYDRSHRMAVLADRLGRTAAEVTAAVFGSGVEDASDAGDLGPDEYLDAIGEHLGTPVSREVWVEARAAATVVDPAVLALVVHVAARTSVALLTNNGRLLREEFARIAPEVAAIPGVRLFASGDLRLAKPDPEVFRTVAAHHGVDPTDALFIDDSPDYVAGAHRAGLRAHPYTTPEALLTFLSTHALAPTP
jgi:HAD superfamily hydrolase (TIGR01509 family)